MKKELEQTQKENKRILNSIKLEDIVDKKKLTQDEIEAMAINADSFFNEYFDKELKVMMYKELERLGKEANTQEELLFSRGVIHGFGIIQEWFIRQTGISKEE